ncbi:MAG: hypothetical protein LBU73_06285 [Helicobacteraceae bacterium]|jgi:tetratricopeptide (TPR) repeat protein|nr:hypothetical protein [Helicobacteraceae bacterium]
MRILLAVFLLVFANCAVFAESGDEAMDRGEKAAKNGKHQEAIKAFNIAIEKFTEVIEKNPRDAKAYTDRGHAYFRKGAVIFKDKSEERHELYKLANADCAAAIEIDPNHTRAYALRALTSTFIGETYYENAIKDAKRACELGNCDLLKLITARLTRLSYEVD